MSQLQQKEFSETLTQGSLPNASNHIPPKPWYFIAPGIWELLLNGDANASTKSVLQWYQPGAKSVTNDIITHTYTEEVVFLDGRLEDRTLRQAWGKGACAYRYPGSVSRFAGWLLAVCQDLVCTMSERGFGIRISNKDGGRTRYARDEWMKTGTRYIRTKVVY